MDGYAPLGAYLGEAGWCVGLELREGRAHSAHEAEYALERALGRAARLTEAPVLVRMDAGFDAGKCFAAIDQASRARQGEGGAPIEALVKWNPRGGGAEAVVEAALAVVWPAASRRQSRARAQGRARRETSRESTAKALA